MLDLLQKARFQVLLLAAGVVLAVLATFRVDDLKALKLVPLDSPVVPILVLGVTLIVASLVGASATAYTEGLSELFGGVKVAVSGGASSARIGDATIAVEQGRLEASVAKPQDTLVVLPANEFFDDACIADSKSALGAFIQAKYPGQMPALQALVASRLRARATQRVQREAGVMMDSYGPGATVFLDRVLGSDFRLLLVAVTTHRQGEGLRATPGILFNLVQAAYVTAREHRICEICLPLLGAGHGTINAELALTAQLLAWCEILYRMPSNMRIRIVVFQADKSAQPSLATKRSKRLLRFALATCRPAT